MLLPVYGTLQQFRCYISKFYFSRMGREIEAIRTETAELEQQQLKQKLDLMNVTLNDKNEDQIALQMINERGLQLILPFISLDSRV